MEGLEAGDGELDAVAEALDALGGPPVLLVGGARVGAGAAAFSEHHRLLAALPADGGGRWSPAAVDVAAFFCLDGAWVAARAAGAYGVPACPRRWDAPEVAVLDGLVDGALRRRLLAGLGGGGWDPTAGPDPAEWSRGTFYDADDGTGGHWGLEPAALERLAASAPVAALGGRLKRWFEHANRAAVRLARPPRAALGDVAPVAANAPVAGEDFAFHRDADPAALPRSEWTDYYGRYPNRSPGAPRWVSALVYLDATWDAAAWGAPTRFLDPATGGTVDVSPRPGRVVLLDQDALHAVTAPDAAAARPRYSLVVKLLLAGAAPGGAAPALARGSPDARESAADRGSGRSRGPRPWGRPADAAVRPRAEP